MKNGQYKIISFYAKKARGLMARWIIKERISTPDQLSAFDYEGYRYSANDSSADHRFSCATPATSNPASVDGATSRHPSPTPLRIPASPSRRLVESSPPSIPHREPVEKLTDQR